MYKETRVVSESRTVDVPRDDDGVYRSWQNNRRRNSRLFLRGYVRVHASEGVGDSRSRRYRRDNENRKTKWAMQR